VLSIVVGVLYFSRTIPTTGTVSDVKSVGCQIYADPGALVNLTSIQWGDVPPNSALNLTIYAKNTGNVAVNYTITTAAWVPILAPTYIGLNYDLKGVVNAPPNSVTPIVLTLSVSPNAPVNTNFSFNVIATASG